MEEGVQYKKGDSLTFNKYSWHNVSNLLFLESPAGVGFSYNTDSSFQYSDGQTAGDNLQAVQDFFRKFPEYTRNGFWLAGESYAGKYIPDLAVLIDQYNLIAATKINFKGMLVGNGVMSFDMLDANRVEYLISKSFIDPEIVNTFRASCFTDPDSAGCRYAKIRIDENTYELNPYSTLLFTSDVFSYCYYNDSLNADPQRNSKSQAGILLEVSKLVKQNITVFGGKESKERPKFNGAPCAYFDGLRQYFNMSTVEYNAKWANMTWNGPCVRAVLHRLKTSPTTSIPAGQWIPIVTYSGKYENIPSYSTMEIGTPWYPTKTLFTT